MIEDMLIFGRAKCVWNDVDAANKALGHPFQAVMAIGRVGTDYNGTLDYWCTFHTSELEKWIETRRKNGYPEAKQYWTSSRGRRASVIDLDKTVCQMDVQGGSSSMIGVMVGMYRLFAKRIVLAGVPMVPEAGYYDRAGNWEEAIKHRHAWSTAKPMIQGRVFSMSGWTKELLGGFE